MLNRTTRNESPKSAVCAMSRLLSLAALIAAAAADADIRKDGRMFFFTTEEELPLAEPAKIFDKIWTMPGISERASLTGS